MLIFDKCLYSSAAVTPDKYERGVVQVISISILLKIREQTERGNRLSNPDPNS